MRMPVGGLGLGCGSCRALSRLDGSLIVLHVNFRYCALRNTSTGALPATAAPRSSSPHGSRSNGGQTTLLKKPLQCLHLR
jgi:hypothetical protein